ncbi:hypothetical protein Tsubulata_015632 [Turnera subulata]|uniref:E3 ubiquitin-protein ligase RMA n=1 Tax=Turnera subulata TaxID=218843 RepID=A0A9Q0GB77_9ROSI|nr:hypothetical protein Tsubulata_015632 [Turnera subulata]
MDLEQLLFENEANFEAVEDGALKPNHKSVRTSTAVLGDDGRSFECNICLDSAYDPVVTLCGHLYCWPCMYRWITVRSSSPGAEQQSPSCPVCKTNISVNSLVPLYGRGTSSSESETGKAAMDGAVPRRPTPSSLITAISNASHQSQQIHQNFFGSQSQPLHHQQSFYDPHGGYATIATANLGVTAMASFFNPMIVMFGELVPARIFGISDMSLFTFPFPNTSPLMRSISPRTRRHEMKLEKSLNRLTIFLLFCIILCLLLF